MSSVTVTSDTCIHLCLYPNSRDRMGWYLSCQSVRKIVYALVGEQTSSFFYAEENTGKKSAVTIVRDIVRGLKNACT